MVIWLVRLLVLKWVNWIWVVLWLWLILVRLIMLVMCLFSCSILVLLLFISRGIWIFGGVISEFVLVCIW